MKFNKADLRFTANMILPPIFQYIKWLKWKHSCTSQWENHQQSTFDTHVWPSDLCSPGGCLVSAKPMSDRSCDPPCTKPRSLCTEVGFKHIFLSRLVLSYKTNFLAFTVLLIFGPGRYSQWSCFIRFLVWAQWWHFTVYMGSLSQSSDVCSVFLLPNYFYWIL